ncbi:MAG TPA: tRNA (pseudouridine(54)-N(1))-methyltransferase TrmY [Polyangiaceae bacterium]|nr:tRNA (pseudouridine(54)-N(1))-methyltransferase TrmY [Polyangiaceae bacterium]
MRSFIVIGRTATASPDFSLEDLPSSSGRLDVLLRCIRAALLYSHGLRAEVRVYLVLRGGPLAPRVLRIEAATARFIRPDERSLALLVKKTIAAANDGLGREFAEIRPGVSLARGDVDCVISDLGGARLYLLDEQGSDVRESGIGDQRENTDSAYFLGDHLGIEPKDRDHLASLGAMAISVGPRSLHSDDAIVVLWNELDRREAPHGDRASTRG